jgi:predicted dehydrogenase
VSSSELRVAIVGLGKMGFLHVGLLSTFPGVRVEAVCEKNRLVAKYAAKIFRRAKITSDMGKLSGMGLDIVYVTTPIPSHFSIIKWIYLHNIARNVFVEKTLASTAKNADELCQMAERSGGTNMVGYQKRYSVTFNRGRKLVHEGTIGEPLSFECEIYSSDFVGLDTGRLKRASASRGGLLRDLGSHAIDLAMWYFGDFRISSLGSKSGLLEADESEATFLVRSLNGVEGSIRASWCKEGYRIPELRLVIRGTSGVVLVSDDKLELKLNSGSQSTWYRHDLSDNVRFLLASPEYYREDEEFVMCVREKHRPNPDFLTASKVDEMVDNLHGRA